MRFYELYLSDLYWRSALIFFMSRSLV
jgi:hypothetical protein